MNYTYHCIKEISFVSSRPDRYGVSVFDGHNTVVFIIGNDRESAENITSELNRLQIKPADLSSFINNRT